jgi:hypothetical protein
MVGHDVAVRGNDHPAADAVLDPRLLMELPELRTEKLAEARRVCDGG